MHRITRGKATHSDRLERWLGSDTVAQLSASMKDFYYPVPVHGVPGKVFVMPGGDFAGDIHVGTYFNKNDGAATVLKKLRRAAEAKGRSKRAFGTMVDLVRACNKRFASVGAFASVDAVVAALTGGKGRRFYFSGVGTAANAIGNSRDLWWGMNQPLQKWESQYLPGGQTYSGWVGNYDVGAADSGHYLAGSLAASVLGNSLLLYDRIWTGLITMNSTATQAVTGVPTRYQSQTAGDDDFIGGNFCFPSVSGVSGNLSATAHNWTVCQYTDQDGNTGQTLPSATGISGCTAGGIDLVTGAWFMPLAAGDIGVKALTQIQCSAAVAAGKVEFVIAHPIAVLACPIANIACLDSGLHSGLNLVHIADGSNLTFLELPKPSTTATSYSGFIDLVSE